MQQSYQMNVKKEKKNKLANCKFGKEKCEKIEFFHSFPFAFLLFFPYIIAKILLFSQIFGNEFFIEFHVLGFFEFKSHTFSG